MLFLDKLWFAVMHLITGRSHFGAVHPTIGSADHTFVGRRRFQGEQFESRARGWRRVRIVVDFGVLAQQRLDGVGRHTDRRDLRSAKLIEGPQPTAGYEIVPVTMIDARELFEIPDAARIRSIPRRPCAQAFAAQVDRIVGAAEGGTYFVTGNSAPIFLDIGVFARRPALALAGGAIAICERSGSNIVPHTAKFLDERRNGFRTPIVAAHDLADLLVGEKRFAHNILAIELDARDLHLSHFLQGQKRRYF